MSTPTQSTRTHHLVPGMTESDSTRVIDLLSDRLVASIDLQLVLKHIHWNVTGPNFIAVHEMLDEHVGAVRGMTDDVAERVATLGGTPDGTAGSVVRRRSWDDYALGRADAMEHLRALDRVYEGVIADNRAAIETIAGIDPITEDLLIEHTRTLEMYQWFVRSFYEGTASTR
jgi:starvation-inducible DNA-binding protein